MKNKNRIFTLLLAVMLCVAAFPLTAFASGGEDTEETVTEPETTEISNTLTPDGNLTLVDDIEGEQAEDKQFITVVTKNGNYFYIIIDRSGDTENVYFLNMVDEADLLALIEDMDTVPAQTPAVCTCTEKCVTGTVNMNCPTCKTDTSTCTGIATVPQGTDTDPTDEPEPEAKQKSSGTGGILLIVLVLAAGGGAYYYFKILKPKQSVKGSTGLDEFDFDDEDDELFDAEPDEQEDDEE